MKINHLRYITIIFIFFTSACSPTAGFGYQPPMLPIKISLDTEGNVSVSWEGKIQTPIGTFSTEIGSDITKLLPNIPSGLVVRVSGNDNVYDLQNYHDIDVVLESGYYKQVRLQKNGEVWIFEAEPIADGNTTSQNIPVLSSNDISNFNLNLIVTVNLVNIRELPSRDSNEIGGAKRNDILKSDGNKQVNDGETWYRVIIPPGYYGSGRVGWISATCIQEIP